MYFKLKINIKHAVPIVTKFGRCPTQNYCCWVELSHNLGLDNINSLFHNLGTMSVLAQTPKKAILLTIILTLAFICIVITENGSKTTLFIPHLKWPLIYNEIYAFFCIRSTLVSLVSSSAAATRRTRSLCVS